MGDNDANLQMALVPSEPPTGFVRAMVGGRDYGTSQYNTAYLFPRPSDRVVVQAVRARGCARGGHPAVESATPVRPFTTGDGQAVHNIEGEGHGPWICAARWFTSINAVFARLISDVRCGQGRGHGPRLGVNLAPYDPVNTA